MTHQDCLFCKIVSGAIPSQKIHDDEDFYAFHDIRPAAPIHALVIPKRHIATLSDCRDEDAPLLGKMMVLTAKLAAQLGCAYTGGDTGFRTVINVGPNGGQEVYHLHAHILGGPHPWTRMG